MALRAFVVLLCLLPWPDVAAAADVEPGEILRRMIVRYEHMETFSAEVRTVDEITGLSGKSQRIESTASIRLGRPGWYRITWADQMEPGGSGPAGTVWSSGEGPRLRIGDRYFKVANDLEALSAATGVSHRAAQTIPSLFFPFLAPQRLLGNLSNLRLLRREEVEGEACYVLAGASTNSEEIVLWISEASQLLVRQTYSPLKGSGFSLHTTVTYSAIRVDAKVEPQAFAYSIPEGAVVSESLLGGLQDLLAASKLPAPEPRKASKPLPNLLAIMLRKTGTGVPGTVLDHVLAKTLAIPGVEAAAVLGSLPEESQEPGEILLRVERSSSQAQPVPQVRIATRLVSAGYFRVMDLGLIMGRPFADRDDRNSVPVAVVNESMAKQAWPGEDPLGRRLSLSPDGPWLTVVGIVRDGSVPDLDRPGEPAVYQPIAQNPPAESFVLLVRTKDYPGKATWPLQEMIDRTFAKELRFEGSRIISVVETPARI